MSDVARTSYNLKHHNTLRLERRAKISFILYSEAGFFQLADREFIIEGPDFSLSGKTDADAKFEFAPVAFGHFDLRIGDACLVIPSVHADAEPHPVYIPYSMIPDLRDAWDSATPDELRCDESLNHIEDFEGVC